MQMQVRALNSAGSLIIPFFKGTYTFNDTLQLMAGVKEEQLLPLIKEFIYSASIKVGEQPAVDISDVNFNSLFQGKTVEALRIFCAVCELQYATFFVEGLELLSSTSNK
jgi:hypothetical protein